MLRVVLGVRRKATSGCGLWVAALDCLSGNNLLELFCSQDSFAGLWIEMVMTLNLSVGGERV